MTQNLTAKQLKRVYRRALYERRKTSGLCTECEQELLPDDTLMCQECAGKNRAARKRYRAGKGAAVEYACTVKARLARQEKGLCRMCERPSAGGVSMCQMHIDYHRQKNKEWRDARRARKAASTPVAAAPIRHDRTPNRFVGTLPLDRLWLEARRTVLGPRREADEDFERRRVSKEYERVLRCAGLLVSNVNQPPPGWTPELDRIEELQALTELSLNRKCA